MNRFDFFLLFIFFLINFYRESWFGASKISARMALSVSTLSHLCIPVCSTEATYLPECLCTMVPWVDCGSAICPGWGSCQPWFLQLTTFESHWLKWTHSNAVPFLELLNKSSLLPVLLSPSFPLLCAGGQSQGLVVLLNNLSYLEWPTTGEKMNVLWTEILLVGVCLA